MAKVHAINLVPLTVIAVVAVLALALVMQKGEATEAQVAQTAQLVFQNVAKLIPSLVFPSGAIELACPEEGSDPECLADFKKPSIKGGAPDICVDGVPQTGTLNAYLADLAELQNSCLNAANGIGDQIITSRESVKCWLESTPLSEEDSFLVSSLCPSVPGSPSVGSMGGIPFTCQDELEHLLLEVRNFCDRVEALWFYYNSVCTNIVDCAVTTGISSESERNAFQNRLRAVSRGSRLQLESIQSTAEWLNSSINGFSCTNLCDGGVGTIITPSGVTPAVAIAPGQFVTTPQTPDYKQTKTT